MRPHRAWIIVFVILLVVDQITKGLARAALNDGNWMANTQTIGELTHLPWPGVFELKLIYNQGVAFGMLQGIGIWMAPIALAIAGYSAWFSSKNRQEGSLVHVSLGLIASGAIGNLIDRVWMGKVTDMLWFRAIDFPVFNVADSAISVGVVLLFVAGMKAEETQPDPEPERLESQV